MVEDLSSLSFFLVMVFPLGFSRGGSEDISPLFTFSLRSKTDIFKPLIRVTILIIQH